MIVVKLQGGLGNQMFQYALGRKLSLLHQTSLKLDLSFLLDKTPRNNFTYRDYNLDIFQLQTTFISQNEIKPFLISKRIGLRDKIYNYIFLKQRYQYIQEKDFTFDSDIFDTKNHVYLDGYWQTDKYFSDVRNVLYDDFNFIYPQSPKNQEINILIKNTNSIAIHFRRSDYIKNESAYNFHGVCSLDYYYHCVDLLLGTIQNPHFFIFSDDHQWVKDNLKLSYPITYVDHNNESKNYEDLRLMSQCKHNIIANSSFSWWGAWLNRNPNKVIYAPKKWFSKSSINTKDIIPDSWIKI